MGGCVSSSVNSSLCGDLLTQANLLLTHNPFVYKGYFYDSETGYYYLKSRYYDPRIHRFISADKIDYLDPKSLSSLNLYVYCGDNPVMGYDPSGCVWWNPFSWSAETWMKFGSMVFAIAGGILLFTPLSFVGGIMLGSGIGSLIGGEASKAAGESYFSGWVGGAIMGASIAIGISTGGAMLGAAISGKFGVDATIGLFVGGLIVAPYTVGFAGGFLGGWTQDFISGNPFNLREYIDKGATNEIFTVLANVLNIFGYACGTIPNVIGRGVVGLGNELFIDFFSSRD